MEIRSSAEKLESLKSIRSTIGKLERALAQMTQKGSNTHLVQKRLQALRIGLAVLDTVWNQKSHPYTQEELIEARHVLNGLLPSIESAYEKSKASRPQKTLLERRIKALELAVQAIDDFSFRS